MKIICSYDNKFFNRGEIVKQLTNSNLIENNTPTNMPEQKLIIVPVIDFNNGFKFKGPFPFSDNVNHQHYLVLEEPDMKEGYDKDGKFVFFVGDMYNGATAFGPFSDNESAMQEETTLRRSDGPWEIVELE